jgi:hypothetical protein
MQAQQMFIGMSVISLVRLSWWPILAKQRWCSSSKPKRLSFKPSRVTSALQRVAELGSQPHLKETRQRALASWDESNNSGHLRVVY